MCVLSESIAICNNVVMEPPASTRQWIESVGQHRFVQWAGKPWEYYERAVEEFAPLAKWIIFIDPDITIDEKSKLAPWLALPHALGACRSELAGGSWNAPQAWHTGLCFIENKVFGKLEKPWFPPFSPTKCGCMAFRDKAIMAGFHSAHAGWVKHDRAGTWH